MRSPYDKVVGLDSGTVAIKYVPSVMNKLAAGYGCDPTTEFWNVMIGPCAKSTGADGYNLSLIAGTDIGFVHQTCQSIGGTYCDPIVQSKIIHRVWCNG